MATAIRLESKKKGVYYRLQQTCGGVKFSTVWYPPKDWATIGTKRQDRELMRAKLEFEQACKSGEILTRAEKCEAQKQAEIEQMKIKTLEQYALEVFLPSKELSCSIRTCAYYERNLRVHIFPTLGELPINEITSAEINALLAKKQKSDISHSLLLGIHTTANLLFEMAYLQDIISVNPMLRVKRPKQKKDDRKAKMVEALTVEQLNDVLNYADREPLKWRCFVYLAANTGMRVGELCALKWSAIDFETREITVNLNAVYDVKNHCAVLSATKTGEERVVPIANEKVFEILKQYRRELLSGGVVPAFVFTSADDFKKPMFPQAPIAYIKKFEKKYKLEKYHLHMHIFRHTYASISITSGIPVVQVAAILGHKDIATTLKMYSHSNSEKEKQAAEKFAEILKAE